MRYLIYNDLYYLLCNKKKWIMLIFFLPVISILINLNLNASDLEIVMISMGSNLSFLSYDSYNIIAIIMYFFNIFCFLYLIIEVYIKDIANNLENIFLRLKCTRYIFRKSLFFIVMMSLIKVVQYIIIILLFLISKNQVPHIFKLLISDISYILLIQYLFLLLYLIYLLFKKNTAMLVITSMMMLIIIPKNIWNSYNYLSFIIMGTVFINNIIYFLFSKYIKSLMENI